LAPTGIVDDYCIMRHMNNSKAFTLTKAPTTFTNSLSEKKSTGISAFVGPMKNYANFSLSIFSRFSRRSLTFLATPQLA